MIRKILKKFSFNLVKILCDGPQGELKVINTKIDRSFGSGFLLFLDQSKMTGLGAKNSYLLHLY